MFQRCFSQPVSEQSDVLQRNENNDSLFTLFFWVSTVVLLHCWFCRSGDDTCGRQWPRPFCIVLRSQSCSGTQLVYAVLQYNRLQFKEGVSEGKPRILRGLIRGKRNISDAQLVSFLICAGGVAMTLLWKMLVPSCRLLLDANLCFTCQCEISLAAPQVKSRPLFL